MNPLADLTPAGLPDAYSAIAMPVIPKSFIVLGAGLMTARVARKLRRHHSTVPEQERVFSKLIPQLAATKHGRDWGIESGMNYAQFRSRVPVRGYEQMAPYIERMKRGEADVLWPGSCAFYVMTSGTTDGTAKWIPVTEQMLAHFRQAGSTSLLYYTSRVGHAGVCRGRHLFLGGSTALTPILESKGFTAYGGHLGGIAALNLPTTIEHHYYEPGTAIAQIEDWPMRLDAIVQQTQSLDISLLSGITSWLVILAEALLAKAGRGSHRPLNLQAIWPNFECLVHGGAPVTLFQDELRLLVGPNVNFHEIYPASEGIIAAQDADPAAGLRLMSDAGLFFEFLPLQQFDENLPSSLGTKPVPFEGVKAGVDYVLLLTTPAGLCRYVLGDVVRFISTAPARLIYIGRTRLQLDAFGEHVTEKDLTDTVTTVCQRHGWTIASFHVAPLFSNMLTGQTRGRHEWWIELKPGSIATPTGPLLSPELDAELMVRRAEYAAKRKGGVLEPPLVRLVMPGVFGHWLRYHSKLDGECKMPRCRSDRAIADELSSVARFNAS